MIFHVNREIFVDIVDKLYGEHLHGVDHSAVDPFDIHFQDVVQGEDRHSLFADDVYLLFLLGFVAVGQAVTERFADLEAFSAVVLADKLHRGTAHRL